MHVVDYWIFRYFCITQVTLIFLLRYMRCMASGKITFAKTQFIAGLGQRNNSKMKLIFHLETLLYNLNDTIFVLHVRFSYYGILWRYITAYKPVQVAGLVNEYPAKHEQE
jgi:hypothetical protein